MESVGDGVTHVAPGRGQGIGEGQQTAEEL